MTFDEVLTQVLELLQREGRVAYRALKRRFEIDDEYVEDLKADLIDAKRLAVDEDGKVLVWIGNKEKGEKGKWGKGETEVVNSQLSVFSPQHLAPNTQLPVTYTPPHLAERIRAATVTDGERKTITALFADLKGSTALIEGLDPEEARAIIDPALQLMMDAVHRYEGYVAQALGDGIFALFGAPIAHEDHPQRAVYAALRMQEEMRRYGDQVRLKYSVPLVMRVGVNTGEVVVRSIRKDDLHTDYVPVGHSTNLAARMEQMATPGSILITDYTRKLVEGYFELRTLGAAEIKGVEAPLSVYEVLGAGPLKTRLQVAARRGLTRFVGRQSEMGQLQRALEQANAGHGQIVGVMGEPGLGKSRLFHEFVGAYCNTSPQDRVLVLQAYSVSHGKASPYLPVTELLKTYFEIKAQDDERKRREKVTGKVLTLDRSLEDTLAYLFALLGIEEQPSPLQQMDPQIRRKRTFEALKKLFLRASLNQPLVLIFEDLHWIDSETQGFLDVLSESVASAKILLLVNYRPEYRHEWGQKTYYTQLRLTPFSSAEAEEFLTFLLGQNPTLTALKQQILTKTEGTPFFMEEVVQELAEQGVLVAAGVEAGFKPASPMPSSLALNLPPTVQGILAARINRLVPEEKILLQQLAVIGREFPVSLIRQVITQSDDELYRLLSSLQHKEFLYEQPAFPEVEYLFKHALTQEVAYNSVLIERRKVLHEQTAQAMEHLYPERLEEHYSELAHHYSRSGNTGKAAEYLGRAGQQAVQRSANTEAITHLTTALDLLKTLPDTPERARQELTLQLTLGVPLGIMRGFTAPEIEQTYTRARALCHQIGETAQLFPALRGLQEIYVVRRQLPIARELGEQLLSLAQGAHDSAFLLVSHLTMGLTLDELGEFPASRVHFEQALALYDPRMHGSLAFLSSWHDPGVACLSRVAWVLWHLGYSDQARQKTHEALMLAQKLSHPSTLAITLIFTALTHQFQREEQRVQAQAEAAMTLATEQGFPLPLALGALLRGWVLAMHGQGEEGIVQMRQGLTACQAIGVEAAPFHLATLAEAYKSIGAVEEGLAVLAEALTKVDSTGERMHEAELYRLKGEFTLQWGSTEHRAESTEQKSKIPNPQSPLRNSQLEAEECFLKAIEIAQKQQAKSWELRASTSLARLWQQQGRQEDAHRMLSEVYNWFTEGFDTKDLQEAKALIEELRR